MVKDAKPEFKWFLKGPEQMIEIETKSLRE